MRYSRFSFPFTLPSVRKVWGRPAPKRSANVQTNNGKGIILAVVVLLLLAQAGIAKTVDYYFVGVITKGALAQTREDINIILEDKEVDRIRFWINSPGGEVVSSFGIYDYLIKVRKDGVVVDTYATGLCASGATIVLQAGETRYITPFCFFMIHRSYVCTGSWWKDLWYNKLKPNKSSYVDNNIIDLYVCRTHLTRQKIEKMMERDCWLYAIEAKELRFVDKMYIGL